MTATDLASLGPPAARHPVPLVVALDGRGTDSDLVGGKAAALDRLVGWGLPVPAAAAVTVAAYRAVTATPALATCIARLVDVERRGGPGPDDDGIDEAFLGAPMPDDVAATLRDAVRAVRSRATSGAIVVRSSATVEDTGAASFAGQYRSMLDVTDDAAALRAIRLVWASLWHAAPRAYRRANGIDPAGAAMGVVVMAQVDARSSGVVFTEDPGSPSDTARVEVVTGLADALVGGRVTPDAYLVDADGTERDRRPTPREALDAVALARRVARASGAPQDVEWAYDGHHVWLVQARPITVAPPGDDPFDTPARPNAAYTTSGIAETLPGVLAPLTWSIAGPAQDDALRALFAAAGATPTALAGARRLIGRHHGRAVLDLDAVRALAASVPGADPAELELQYVGAAVDAPRQPNQRRSRRGSRRLRSHGRDAARAGRAAAADAAVVAIAVDRVIDADVRHADLADDALLAYHRRLVDLGRRAITDEAIVAATAAAAHRRLEALLRSWFDADDARRWASLVAAPAAGAVTLNGVDFAAADLARRAGARAVFGGPAWDGVAAAELDALLAAHARVVAPARTDVDAALERTLRARPGWQRTRVLTGQVVDVRLHLLRRTVADARTWLARRDAAKAAVLRLGGELRRVHRAIGRRLVAVGVLADAADVELLSADELAPSLHGVAPTRAELGRRRRQLRGHATTDLPAMFVGHAPTIEPPVPTGDRLTGWPAGTGRARGRPRVVRDPLTDELDDGDVLVATTTDASWVPLFLRAGALVLERGGPLSHAAICARELGLPAVVNVPGAVARLDRERGDVVVDGDAGTVTVVHAPRTPIAAPVEPAAPERVRPLLVETLDDIDAPALHVFVPAVMSLGLLASLGSLLVDGVRSLTRTTGSHRRSDVAGRLTATATLSGEECARRDRAGLRERRTYVAASIASFALAAYVVVGQSANYARSGGYLSEIAWLWATALLVGCAFVTVGVLCAQVALHDERPPPSARAVLAWTVLTRRGARPVSPRRGPGTLR